MADLTSLKQDLLESLRVRPRPYSEVMEAWKTSCPRLDIWETVQEEGLVRFSKPEGVAEFWVYAAD